MLVLFSMRLSVCLSVCLRVCVYVCVNKPKSGSVVWLRVFWQVFVCLFVLLSQQNLVSVATVGDADMKLGRCVTATNMQVEFDDGCDTTSWILRTSTAIHTCVSGAGVIPLIPQQTTSMGFLVLVYPYCSTCSLVAGFPKKMINSTAGHLRNVEDVDTNSRIRTRIHLTPKI